MSVTVSRSFSASVRPRFFRFPGIATPIMSDTRPAAVSHPPSHRRSGPASGRPNYGLQSMPEVRKTPPSLVAAWFPTCVGMTTCRSMRPLPAFLPAMTLQLSSRFLAAEDILAVPTTLLLPPFLREAASDGGGRQSLVHPIDLRGD